MGVPPSRAKIGPAATERHLSSDEHVTLALKAFLRNSELLEQIQQELTMSRRHGFATRSAHCPRPEMPYHARSSSESRGQVRRHLQSVIPTAPNLLVWDRLKPVPKTHRKGAGTQRPPNTSIKPSIAKALERT
jgi:hypothetical protein